MPISSPAAALRVRDAAAAPAPVTPLGVAILALLGERDMHPYEMLQLLRERREDELVKVRPGSLYHGVERLLRDDLIEEVGTDREGNRPERTTYRLTACGRGALDQWVDEHLGQVENSYPSLPLALAEVHTLTPQRVRERLAQRLVTLEQQIDGFRRDREVVAERKVPPVYVVAPEYRLAMCRAERDFVAALIHRIGSLELTWPSR